MQIWPGFTILPPGSPTRNFLRYLNISTYNAFYTHLLIKPLDFSAKSTLVLGDDHTVIRLCPWNRVCTSQPRNQRVTCIRPFLPTAAWASLGGEEKRANAGHGAEPSCSLLRANLRIGANLFFNNKISWMVQKTLVERLNPTCIHGHQNTKSKLQGTGLALSGWSCSRAAGQTCWNTAGLPF